MARSNIKAVFENDVQTVWNVITDVKNYIWRTDLSKTEIISDKQFIEYTKNGYLKIKMPKYLNSVVVRVDLRFQ
mgnify:CR=1 FL=1